MTPPWQRLLQQRIAPAMAWRVVLGDHFDGLSRFLMASGALADFLPCPRTSTTHCGYTVRPGEKDDEFVGFCPEGECPRVELSRSDIALLEVDWLALAGRLGSALGLTGSPSLSAPGIGMLGWVAPTAPSRLPVFLALGREPAEVFDAAQRFAEQSPARPFALVVLSRDALNTECLALLHRRGADVVALDEAVEVSASGELAAPAAAKHLVEFALAQVRSGAQVGREPLDTPDGATWEDVTVREIDGHTIEIHCQVHRGRETREARQTYSCEGLGLVKKSAKGIKPSAGWSSFLLPILQRKRVAASDADAWLRLRQTKKAVAKLLEDLTGLPAAGAFTAHAGRLCYEAVFKVECSPSDELPVPDPPDAIVHQERLA